jgi:hypothetical protein
MEGGKHHLKGSQASPACPSGSVEMYEDVRMVTVAA